MRALAIWIGILLSGLSATAHAKAAPALIDVRIAVSGQLAELRLEGEKLRIATTAGGPTHTRAATPVERAQLVAAATAAVRVTDVRRTCSGRNDEELFISVTLDRLTLGTALCPPADAKLPDPFAPWRELARVAREIAAR